MKKFARPAIAGILVGLAVLHHFVTSVDAISLALVVLALALFLAPWLESLEIPGLIKIGYRDVSEAGKKITSGAPTVAPAAADAATGVGSSRENLDAASVANLGTQWALASISDPNLSLVALRIEIEKRLRRLGSEVGITDERLPLPEVVRRLGRRGEGRGRTLLNDDMVSGLLDLISLGNKAAHGARVDQAAADWASTVGPAILEQLDNLVDQRAQQFGDPQNPS
jgi:hypothetical protein